MKRIKVEFIRVVDANDRPVDSVDSAFYFTGYRVTGAFVDIELIEESDGHQQARRLLTTSENFARAVKKGTLTLDRERDGSLKVPSTTSFLGGLCNRLTRICDGLGLY